MLVNLLISLFRKYIYSSHIHNWEFDRTVSVHTDVMGLTTNGDEIMYKCMCGKVICIKR